MFSHIKQVFSALLNFSGSLATKCVSLNNESSIIRSTRIDINPIEFNYYPFMVSLNKCNESCTALDDVSSKKSIPTKTKHTDARVFNFIRRINEAKTLVKCISCDCKCRFDSTTCNSNLKWNNGKCQCECKKYHTCKKDYS